MSPCVVAEQSDAVGGHLVLDGLRTRHRLRFIQTGAADPTLEFLLPKDPLLAERLTALSAFALGTAYIAKCQLTSYRRYHLVGLLAVLDLVEHNIAGDSNLRRIAADIFSARAARARAIDWKGSSERRQAQRALAKARHMAGGGYRLLLAGRPA